MARDKELDFILLQNYNPDDDSPLKFRQRYSLLAKHRDELRKKYDAKERKPSAKASELHGSRFSSLAEHDNSSTISPPTKHQFSASLTADQLENLLENERQVEMTKIKRDIEALMEEKKARREAVAAEAKERRAQKEVKETTYQHEADKEDQGGEGESELGPGWEKVNRSATR